jgi:hypothetical protein
MSRHTCHVVRTHREEEGSLDSVAGQELAQIWHAVSGSPEGINVNPEAYKHGRFLECHWGFSKWAGRLRIQGLSPAALICISR